MRKIAHIGCALFGALFSFACAHAFADENLNEKFGPTWDCSYITYGLPLYDKCITCDLKTQDFIQTGPNDGQCRPKMHLRDRLKKTLDEPTKSETPATPAPTFNFPVYPDVGKKGGSKSTITCNTCKSATLPDPGVTRKISPPPGFHSSHDKPDKSTITTRDDGYDPSTDPNFQTNLKPPASSGSTDSEDAGDADDPDMGNEDEALSNLRSIKGILDSIGSHR